MDPSISFDDSNSGHQMGINRGRVTNIYYASPYHQNETPHSQNSQPRQAERHVMIPFARNPRFVGRGNVIQNVTDQILSTDHTVARKAGVSGLGGIGKTQIALEVAHFISEKDPARSIFWIPATSLEAAEQAFHDIARRLRLPNEKRDDPKTLVNDHLNSGRAGAWLLIVDNADESNMWNTNSKTSFKGFIPHSKEGFVLYTSRNQGLLTQIVGPNIIKLEEMDESNARRLFKDHLVEKTAANDKNSTSLLLQQLCLLPLALIQAASFINENAISVQKYLEMLSQQEEELPELLEEDFENEYRYPGLENAISATWLISFQRIKRSNDIAFQYLCFIACIDSRDIPLSILPPTQSELLKQKAIGILKAYSFIATQVDKTKYSMHRLVHLATRKWLQKEGALAENMARAHDNLLIVFPSDEPENRQLWRQYLPHAQAFLLRNNFLVPPIKRWILVCKVANCLIIDDRIPESLVLYLAEVNRRLQCEEGGEYILDLAK